MKNTTTIITILFISFYCLVALQLTVLVRAEGQPNTINNSAMLIVEAQTGSSNSASEEFVELANVTAREVDLTDMHIEYKSASGSTWQKKASLQGAVGPYSRILVASYELSEDQLTMKSGLAAGGGHIRIRSKDDAVLDLIGWGSANQSNGQPVEAADAGQSFKRLVDQDGYFVNSSDNSQDFILSDTPTPHTDGVVEVGQPEPVTVEEVADEAVADAVHQVSQLNQTMSAAEVTDGASVAQVGQVAQIAISEVLPDPIKPHTDAEHEMIELFNAGTSTANLSGYVLETGSKGQYDYTLPSLELAPGEYFALYAADTGLVLANNGGKAALKHSSGVEVASVPYSKAKAGKSWANVGDAWVWAQPTPNQPNSLPEDVVPSASQSSQGNDAQDAQLDKKDVEYASAASDSSSDSSGDSASGSPSEDAQPNVINNSILAAVGALAVLYMLYEYRSDIRILLGRLRGYFSDRKATGGKT